MLLYVLYLELSYHHMCPVMESVYMCLFLFTTVSLNYTKNCSPKTPTATPMDSALHANSLLVCQTSSTSDPRPETSTVDLSADDNGKNN